MASRDLGDAPLEGDANRPSAPRGPTPCSALALALIFLLASVYSAHSSRRLKGFTLLYFFFYLRSLRCVGPAGLPHRRPQANRVFYSSSCGARGLATNGALGLTVLDSRGLTLSSGSALKHASQNSPQFGSGPSEAPCFSLLATRCLTS